MHLKEPANVISNDPPYAKISMPDSQRYPEKDFSDQVWIRYPCLWFGTLMTYKCGFFKKVTCAFLLQSNKLRV